MKELKIVRPNMKKTEKKPKNYLYLDLYFLSIFNKLNFKFNPPPTTSLLDLDTPKRQFQTNIFSKDYIKCSISSDIDLFPGTRELLETPLHATYQQSHLSPKSEENRPVSTTI